MSSSPRYTVLRKVTDGGTAEIFLAKQHGAAGFEKTVVIKRIFTTLLFDLHFRHLLVDEARVAMSLNHGNIVQVLDLGEDQGRYFLVIELVDGWSLGRILERARAAHMQMPPAVALHVIVEVCRALAYAHAKKGADGKPLGIVHCDVNPRNVLISEQGEVKLFDFGLARVRGKIVKTDGNSIQGSVDFMSPEQASGGELDARSDLFSVGTMMYAMLIGRHPFGAAGGDTLLTRVKSDDFEPPETARSGLHPEIYRVIRRAMGKTPAGRYQTAQEMLADVERAARLAFGPAGRTELERWLQGLSAQDGVPPLTRQAPTEPTGNLFTLGRLIGPGQEPPPPPAASPPVIVRSSRPPAVEPSVLPPALAPVDPPSRRRWVDRVGLVLVLLLVFVALEARLMHRRSQSAELRAPRRLDSPGQPAAPRAPPPAESTPPATRAASHG